MIKEKDRNLKEASFGVWERTTCLLCSTPGRRKASFHFEKSSLKSLKT
jgi:hypothetical protein